MASGRKKPRCEGDDCYCKAHWPDRNAGEEFKVVHNLEDGRYAILCPMGYQYHHLETGVCSACGKRMIGPALEVKKIKVCVRCCDGCHASHTSNIVEYFAKHVLSDGETSLADGSKSVCEFHRLFRFSLDRVADPTLVEDAVLCQKCKTVHPPPLEDEDSEYDELFFFGSQGEYVPFNGRKRCLKKMGHLFEEYPDEFEPLREVILKFVEYKRELFLKKRAALITETKSVKELAYQVLAKYITPENAETSPHTNSDLKAEMESNYFIDEKLLESEDLLDREELQSLLDTHQPVNFILWLTQNHHFE